MLTMMTESESKKRVLFVCTQNKVRSLTAEHLYRVRPDLEVKSCGTATFAKNQLSKELLNWAEAVFTFDESHMEAIAKNFSAEVQTKPVICLGLPDIFTYKSDALVVKLTAKIEPYLGRPNARKCPRNSVFYSAEESCRGETKSAETSEGFTFNYVKSSGRRGRWIEEAAARKMMSAEIFSLL
jgi:predicted protein tyrosine phosphatase